MRCYHGRSSYQITSACGILNIFILINTCERWWVSKKEETNTLFKLLSSKLCSRFSTRCRWWEVREILFVFFACFISYTTTSTPLTCLAGDQSNSKTIFSTWIITSHILCCCCSYCKYMPSRSALTIAHNSNSFFRIFCCCCPFLSSPSSLFSSFWFGLASPIVFYFIFWAECIRFLCVWEDEVRRKCTRELKRNIIMLLVIK